MWEVVVKSKKPDPAGNARYKFVTSFPTEAEAVAECARRVEMEADRIATLHEQGSSETPFEFSVVKK